MLYIKNLEIEWDKSYLGRISATFKEGQISIITGKNGIGKTTLLYCLALLKDTRGIYKYNNQAINFNQNARDTFRYQNISLLLQEMLLFDEMTLKDYLDMMSGMKHNEYDVSFPLHKKISQLSLGERQYLLIYGLILQDKAIYMFDEPTTALDIKMKQKILGLFEELKQRGKIIIIVTHDEEVYKIADTIYEFKNQQLYALKNSDKTIIKEQSHHNLLKLSLFKSRIKTFSFKSVTLLVMILAFLVILFGNIVHKNIQNIDQQLTEGKRQEIIVYTNQKPYIYYDGICIESYQYDKKFGYKISFQNEYDYNAIMKILKQEISIKNIESLYLNASLREELTQQRLIITLFYYISLLIITILTAVIYREKTKNDLQYNLLLKLLGFSKRQQFKYILIEILIFLLLLYVLLHQFLLEWIMMCVFVGICYSGEMMSCYKEFAYLYRNTN